MARDLTAGMVTEVTAVELRPAMFLKASFPSGDLNLWSGIGDKVFAGDTYTGAGDLIEISELRETEETRAAGAAFRLSGVPSSLIAIALGEEYQGRPVKLWLAMLTAAGAIVADPYLLFTGRMDVMEHQDSGETAALTLQAENAMVALERPRVRRYTAEDQRLDFPLDTGFDRVTALQDAEILWGATT